MNDATTPDLLHERLPNDIHLITLNRPASRNAVSFDMWERFSTALDMIERDTPPRAVIVTGADKFFCAGGDIKVAASRGFGPLANAARLEIAHRTLRRIREVPAPVIAAVEGRAVGIGWSLALACDIVVAADDASFSAPFLKLGMVPDGGIAWFLIQRIGRQRTAEILFSGRSALAGEALGLGLVSTVVTPGKALTAAIDMATAFCGPQRDALELTKRLINEAETSDLASVLASEAAYFQLIKLEAIIASR